MYPAPTPDGAGLIYAANPMTAEAGLWWKSLRRRDEPPRPITSAVGEYSDLNASQKNGSVVATVVDVRQTLMKLAVGPDSVATLHPITSNATM